MFWRSINGSPNSCRKAMKKYLIILIILSFLQVGCDNENSQNNKSINKKDSLNSKTASKQSEPEFPNVSYHLISVKENIAWLKALNPGDTLNTLMLLNCVDKKHLLKQDTLVVPDSIVANIGLYSPFPPAIAALQPVNKIILVSYPAGAFSIYEKGKLIRWGATSLGKKSTPTPTGLFFTNWKAKKTTSTVDDEWVMEWYFNLDNKEGVSLHEYELPGYPASHSCMRLSEADAFWIYNWANQWILSDKHSIAAYGTPVIIYGTYPFGQRKPRYKLASDGKALQITQTELTSVVNEYIPLITKRQTERDSVVKMNSGI